MRTTVNLDPGAHAFASAYAGARGITLSTAINELVLRAEQTPEPSTTFAGLKRSPHGYLIIAGTGDPITPEMVKVFSEDEIG